MSQIEQFDAWLELSGPAAIIIREPLMPVEGEDGVVFPATFAAAEDKKLFAGGYNIDLLNEDGSKNVCLVDSVGSQANRIEPLFAESPYSSLVPQISVVAGDKQVSIFEAGHRAGDALVRCSELQVDLDDAFKQVRLGNAEPLASIAPTSIVFGVWDSRNTQAKLPRLISSTIRAFDVSKLTRSAQFVPATDYVESGLLPEPSKNADQKKMSERGFTHVPATGSHGGVIAHGGIRRDATLALAAIRPLKASDDKRTQDLKRYILGLALVAFTAPTPAYIRQGCILVLNPDSNRILDLVHSDGTREALSLTHEEAIEYAATAAKAFGVGESRSVPFDAKLAKADLKSS